MENIRDNLPSFTVSGLVFVVCYISWSIWNQYQFFERRGLKGPKPWPLIGHLGQMVTNDLGKLQTKWVQEHGKVFGIFFGVKPRLFIGDPDVMTQICVKDFDAFPNHAINPMHCEIQRNFLVFLQGDHWRKVRALLTPTFTSSKIRRMFGLLDGCVDDLIDLYREQLVPVGANQGSVAKCAVVNAKELYTLFAMDSIATCCYGLKLQRAGAKNMEGFGSRNSFVGECNKLFKSDKLKMIASVLLPQFIIDKVILKIMLSQQFEPVAKFVQKLIDNRRKSGKKFDDYLQLILNTKLQAEVEVDMSDIIENHHAGLSEQSIKEDQRKLVDSVTKDLATSNRVTLNDLEILSGAIFLLLVGLETTGTVLSHCTYLLAHHQEQQEKLYREIKKIAKYDEKTKKFVFDYDELSSCVYLDAIISETMRCIPTISFNDRIATRDCYIEKYKFMVPKGTAIAIGYYSMLKNPEYWPEPEKFDPERFMPGNKEKIYPSAYCPFGLGPRHCLGMRFALSEMKLAIAKLVMNFRLLPVTGTTFPTRMKFVVGICLIENPIINVVPRE